MARRISPSFPTFITTRKLLQPPNRLAEILIYTDRSRADRVPLLGCPAVRWPHGWASHPWHSRGGGRWGECMLRNVVIAYSFLLAFATLAGAKEWAQKMFPTTSHDFGHVARGSKAEFAFEIQNLYEEDVHIADVKTSCGCTTPTVTKATL